MFLPISLNVQNIHEETQIFSRLGEVVNFCDKRDKSQPGGVCCQNFSLNLCFGLLVNIHITVLMEIGKLIVVNSSLRVTVVSNLDVQRGVGLIFDRKNYIDWI